MHFHRISKNVPASQSTLMMRASRSSSLVPQAAALKVRGLTRTGRQVSEDPDLDNLLSTLSPEEMEELEKDMMKVPDLNPEDGKIIVQGEGQAAQLPRSNNVREAKLDRQREQSLEGEAKKESRKQEYLRKMGLSQEGNDDTKGGLRRQASVSSERDAKADDRNSKGPESSKEERSRLSSRYRKQDGKEGDAKEEANEKEKNREELVNHSDHVKEKEKRISAEKKAEEKKEKDDSKGKVKKVEETEKLGNCVAKNTPNSKVKEEEDEDSSMFDELMEQVRSNDPSLTELNVNNSEVIKTKTLIEFAEALHNNTHVKTFALANCRADDHVAYAIAGTIRSNKTITSINLDSNHLTGKGILSLIQALQHNSTLTELRFQNQRHICGGKTEMEMTKILKENTTLLKLGYHFELAGPRMTTTNILSRNMDRQRQRRLQEQKQAQANGEKKGTLEVPKTGGGGSLRNSPKASPKPSPIPSPMPSPKLTPKRGAGGLAPPPPPPPGGGPPPPPPPMLDVDGLRNSLTPGGSKNSRDQLLASIRGSNIKQLKKVPVPKWLHCRAALWGRVEKHETPTGWMKSPHYEFSPQTLDQKDSVENE
ncbi:leiomodin-1 [Lates japonicus]|uniref:Leiomodin-1 n=1 Tax=Lates japonicus TaxID=270547 RepID=A0AAD3N2L6_LATJO|nr:leiomodin-1 [Lates japonicus]